MVLTIQQLERATCGRLLRTAADESAQRQLLSGRVAIDSRHVRSGDVFWALTGSRHDGAEFAGEAFARGAAGVVAAQRRVVPPAGRWVLSVEDTQRALWRLAAWKRQAFQGRVVAVTGSVGKTTTRMMIDAVLSRHGSGSTCIANYNNHVGLPLSMLAMERPHTYAAYELGASAAGEIAALAALCLPQIGVITGIEDAHLEGFGSRAGVADAKGELLEALPPEGCAVLCGDDPALRRLAGRHTGRCVWFGRGVDCDVTATAVRSNFGWLHFESAGQAYRVPVQGRHFLAAALAAVAVGREFGVPPAVIADALAGFQPPPQRCHVTFAGGVTIIDDTYNASPASMRAALALLRETPSRGRRVAVCGDMKELGAAAEALHRAAGEEVVTLGGADVLLACGEHAAAMAAGAVAAGLPEHAAVVGGGPQHTAKQLTDRLQPADTVLVKGSRAMRMERVVAAVQETIQSWHKETCPERTI